MSSLAILAFIFLTILVIIIAVIFTIAIDNLARLTTPEDVVKATILNNVIGLGSFIVIILIFLIAVGLIGAILAYYYGSLATPSGNWLFYTGLVFTFLTLGLLILEFYTYRELTLFRATKDETSVFNNSVTKFQWGLALTILLFILSLLTLFLI